MKQLITIAIVWTLISIAAYSWATKPSYIDKSGVVEFVRCNPHTEEVDCALKIAQPNGRVTYLAGNIRAEVGDKMIHRCWRGSKTMASRCDWIKDK